MAVVLARFHREFADVRAVFARLRVEREAREAPARQQTQRELRQAQRAAGWLVRGPA